MRNRNSITVGVALLFVALLAAVGASGQNADNTHPAQVPQGQKQKIQGIVSIRNGDAFKVRDPGGAEYTVLLTGSTDVTSHSRGIRGKKDYP
jgi:endonuclease YncB( thermonuclease family)